MLEMAKQVRDRHSREGKSMYSKAQSCEKAWCLVLLECKGKMENERGGMGKGKEPITVGLVCHMEELKSHQ